MQILRFAQDDIGGGLFSVVLEDLLRRGQFPVSNFDFPVSNFQFPVSNCSMDELLLASATRIAQAIREKKVSSEEFVKACLARIEEVNPRLNAVVQLPAEAALAAPGISAGCP